MSPAMSQSLTMECTNRPDDKWEVTDVCGKIVGRDLPMYEALALFLGLAAESGPREEREAIKIEACASCGGGASVQFNERDYVYSVRCNSLECPSNKRTYRKEDAIKAWNTRYQPNAIGANREGQGSTLENRPDVPPRTKEHMVVRVAEPRSVYPRHVWTALRRARN